MTMKNIQNTQNNFNEVEYLVDVAKIRHEIINLMGKNQVMRENADENTTAEINPYFGRIAKDGSVGVEFAYGYPVSICTPFGKVRIGVPMMSDENDSYAEQAKIYHKMQMKFGLVEVEPAVKKAGVGEFGPYYAVTRLPWKKNEMLPGSFERVNRVNNGNYAVQAENKRANQILMQACAVVAKFGVNGKKAKCVIGNNKVKSAAVEMGL